MPLKGTIATDVELKSSAEKFYNVFKAQAFHIPKHTPSNIQAVQVHEGDWEGEGSIKIWNYTLGGKAEVFKEKVEFDNVNKIVKLNGLEGDVMKIYKVYNPIFYLVPKGEGCVAKLSIEYEKQNPNVPLPEIYLDFVVNLTKDIDAGLAKA